MQIERLRDTVVTWALFFVSIYPGGAGTFYTRRSSMKKILFVSLLVIVIAAFIVPVAFAQTEEPPKIEQFDYVAQLIIGFVTVVVTFGLKAMVKEWGIDLTGKATQITAAIVTAIFEFLNGLLASVPPAWFPVVVSGLGFLTALLTAFGVASYLKGRFALAAKK